MLSLPAETQAWRNMYTYACFLAEIEKKRVKVVQNKEWKYWDAGYVTVDLV